MDEAGRIASLGEFWPYYLGEHQHPGSRRLHFLGTTAFLAFGALALAHNPLGATVATVGLLGELALASVVLEHRRPAFLPLLGAVAILFIASRWFVAGVLVAYGCAWVGHFRLEQNRPATFRYPIWSLLCDFRMWGAMCTGRYWSGPAAP